MRNSWLIALREVRERVGARSFILMSVFGPLIVLGLIYLMFVFGGNQSERWNVLITDPAGIMQSKILANKDAHVNYSIANGYVEHEEFADAKKYQQFDAMVEINEKILGNKISHVFYRSKPSLALQSKVQYQVERRLEEVLIAQFTDLSIAKFRELKQPINFSFRNVYDPLDQSSDIRAWVGFFFGTIILVFIALFGMTILRTLSREKSNRIVEVLLASVKPRQLLVGKLAGVGISAFIQFLIWTIIIGAGLYFMRETMFPDMYDASKMNVIQMSQDAQSQTLQEQLYLNSEYNHMVDLVYERINFSTMLTYFILFFLGGYLFYGAFFAAIGSTTGTESDGQQFVLPILLILGLSVYAGYFSLSNPTSDLSIFFHYFPFTSPIVVMVKLAQGYEPGHTYEIWVSLIILFIASLAFISIASRLYKNGILQFGHRLRLKHIIKWLKRT